MGLFPDIWLIKPIVIFLILAGKPWSSFGNPMTKLQFVQLKTLLEEKIHEAYPSDDQDNYADTLIQEIVEGKNLTGYHAGNPSLPVFVSFGVGNIGKKVHVLLRGEDYMNPKDRNNFVVLRQMSSPETYSVHIAYVVDNTNIKKSNVVWNDGRVEQQKLLGKLLEKLGNPEIQARSARSKRPICDWFGYYLLCDSKKNVKPMRERQPRQPLDEVDAEPQKAFTLSDEVGGSSGQGKNKRQIVISSPSYKQQTTAGKTINNEAFALSDIGDGISEEDRAVIFKTEEKPASLPNLPSAVNMKPSPPTEATNENSGSGILVPISKAPAAKPESEDTSTSSKKKHKKKHKKGKKD